MSTLSRKVSLLPGSPTGSRENSGRGESSLNAPAAPASFPYQLATEHPQSCTCNQCAWNRGLTQASDEWGWWDAFTFLCGFWAGAIVGIAGTLVIGLAALLGLSLT